MLLAALLLKLGSYGMLRLAPVMPFPSRLIICTTVCLTGSLLISLSIIIHPDLKYIIAVSSVVHISYATLQTLTQTTYSAHGRIIALITHSYISSGIFLIAGELSNNSNRRNILLNTKIARNNPCLYFWALVTFFANVGAPPFISFLSELAIIKILLPKGFLRLSLWFATNFILIIQTLLLIRLISSASLPSSAKPPAVKISLRSFILLSPATIISP